MKFGITYIMLKLKELFRSGIYIGFGAFILLLAISMALLLPRVDENSPYTLAILNESGSKLGEAATAALERDGGYRLQICTDRRELEALVLSGEALCGYAFTEKADERVQNGRYTGLADSFYREKSPAAALCDEAVCGAVFEAISPLAAARYLEQNKLADDRGLKALKDGFATAVSGGSMMKITLLGADSQPVDTQSGRTVTALLYSAICSLTAVFAITTAFYTQSIDKSLIFAGQEPALVGLCSFLSYSASYLFILWLAHLSVACLRPELLADGGILWQLFATAVVSGVLQQLARRFVSPAAVPVVVPLLPFAAVLLAAVTVL